MFKSIQKSNTLVFILTITFAAIIVKVIGTLIGDALIVHFLPKSPAFSSNNQLAKITFSDFMLSVIIAPPLETFLGQYLPIKIIGKFTNDDRIKIILSACIFAFLHLPVLGFMLGAFFVGVVYAWAYIVRNKLKKSDAFLVVAQSHALQNLLSFLVVLLAGIKS